MAIIFSANIFSLTEHSDPDSSFTACQVGCEYNKMSEVLKTSDISSINH